MKRMEEYLGYALTNVSKQDSEELLLLSRRIQYITTYSSDESYIDDLLEKLSDVNSSTKVLIQLQNIYRD